LRKLYLRQKGSEQAIKSIKMIIMTCVVTILAGGAAAISSEAADLPDSISVTGSRQVSIASKPYIELVAPDDEATGAAVTVDSSYTVTAMLHGVLPIKSIEVTRISQEYVELSGRPVGIMLYSDGLVVAGLSPVSTDSGMVNPGQLCGLQPGDVIRTINGDHMQTAEQMLHTIESSNGQALQLEILRSDGDSTASSSLTLQPVYSSDDNSWRGGIWIKETSSGLGMLTFVTTDTSSFGGLGHAICDVDTGEMMPLSSGEAVDVTITGVNRGSSGFPGELKGSFSSNKVIGELNKNDKTGIYGSCITSPAQHKPVPIATRTELHPGEAQIYCTVSGSTPQSYDVMIEKVSLTDSGSTKNMVIRITDPDLLQVTGGIVQGMSGSPIIQDGKLVGAVTHVFVNDPTRGYGIFIENMLEAVA